VGRLVVRVVVVLTYHTHLAHSVDKFVVSSGKCFETRLGPLVGAADYPLPSVILTAWVLLLIPTRDTEYFL
jgi:hypothetical protein